MTGVLQVRLYSKPTSCKIKHFTRLLLLTWFWEGSKFCSGKGSLRSCCGSGKQKSRWNWTQTLWLPERQNHIYWLKCMKTLCHHNTASCQLHGMHLGGRGSDSMSELIVSMMCHNMDPLVQTTQINVPLEKVHVWRPKPIITEPLGLLEHDLRSSQ